MKQGKSERPFEGAKTRLGIPEKVPRYYALLRAGLNPGT